MDKKNIFYGAIEGFNEEKKTVEAIILHFDTPNENLWMAKTGSLDAFLERLQKSGKRVAAYYQHNDEVLIGGWEVWIEGNMLKGILYLSDTPFVRDTVIPQLKDKTLQGASPEIGALQSVLRADLGVEEVIEGVLAETSLVGLPADLEANITKVAAKIEQQKNENFEIELLTL